MSQDSSSSADPSIASETVATTTTPVADGAGATDSAKISKMVYCETCGFGLNSEVQATAHYSGKSHLKKVKQLGSGSGHAPGTAPSSGLATKHTWPACQNKWGTAHESKFGATSSLQQPKKSMFSQRETNVESYVALKEYGMLKSKSECTQPPPISSNSSDNTLRFGAYGQILPPTEPTTATPPQVVLNSNPVEKAVLDNFLGILPTKRRKIVNCDLCDMIFNSDSQANAHFEGTKHKRKLNTVATAAAAAAAPSSTSPAAADADTMTTTVKEDLKTSFFCEICSITVNSQKQLDAHFLGQSHKNKTKSVKTGNNGNTEHQGNLWTEVTGHQPGWFFCSVCNISVPTPVALNQHVTSTGHIDRKKQDKNGS